MNKQQHIGLLGGTFDPIHLGHVHIARQCIDALHLDAVELIPCHQPAHRAEPIASESDRKIMIELAIANDPQLILNPMELDRRGVSYTIDTLKARATPQQILYWIIGFDAFLQFHTWHHWHEILRYCHLIVVNRPNFPTELPAPLVAYVKKHEVQEALQLRQFSHGKLLQLSIPPCQVSATQIRAALQQGKIPEAALAPAVAHYLTQHALYQHNS